MATYIVYQGKMLSNLFKKIFHEIVMHENHEN
jgi:hypothetical protein